MEHATMIEHTLSEKQYNELLEVLQRRFEHI